MSGWRHFQGKALPPRDDGASQKTAFSKCCAVMHALLGKKPEAHECEQDPEFWFKFLWYRLCSTFGWRTDNMWAVSTCYDKLNDQKIKRDEACRATETPSVAQAAAQATVAAEVGMRSATALLQEAALVPCPSSEPIPRPQVPIVSGEVECIRCCFCAAYMSVTLSINDRRRTENTNMLQHMRQKHQNDAFWLKLQKLMGPGWHPHDVLKAWVRVCPRVPCCKSQPDGHFVYKPAYLPQIAATFGGVQDYCGDLFRDLPHGIGLRVLPSSAFMGMFQAGTEILGVHYDKATDTLFAGNMVHGLRHLSSGSVYKSSKDMFSPIVMPSDACN